MIKFYVRAESEIRGTRKGTNYGNDGDASARGFVVTTTAGADGNSEGVDK